MMNRENLDKYYLDRIPYPKDYIPTDWVRSVVNTKYRSSGKIWICIGYDPGCGFWMENIETMKNSETSELTNISERAIDRTFHKVYENKINE